MQHTEKITSTVFPILKRAGVTRSAVFGSFARGTQRNDSDVDIVVEMPRKATLFDFIRLKLALENALEKKVDLVEYDSIKPHLRESILKDQITIA